MDFKDIERLLDKYYEGATTVEEEKAIREFFTNGEVPAHLKAAQAQFQYFAGAAIEEGGTGLDEALHKMIATAPATKKIAMPGWPRTAAMAASVAATIIIAGALYFNQPGSTPRQPDHKSLLAYAQAKQALLKISANLNKGNVQVARLSKLGDMEQLITDKKQVR